MFKPTSPLLGGLLWKIPWRLSRPQKARQRKRLRAVDRVVDTVSAALQRNGGLTTKAVERWYAEMPREEEMVPKDKYTIFDKKEKKYRKGLHSAYSPDLGWYSVSITLRIADWISPVQNFPSGLV
ncbi:conserved hypothetical protein [Paecilomyces variotii No. 5]|uniref:54S ribosomal protein L31, mitochondrial n=1 Tax=Byssochlamys spectabilis (strain No. 5 / NBRC 109023) TaxID=1356009 RepID=V5G5M0_BYSSN|nr:conserved hypothetical protein [Paecilomyces variotii No. 5]